VQCAPQPKDMRSMKSENVKISGRGFGTVAFGGYHGSGC
jgi:hypothetical protein